MAVLRRLRRSLSYANVIATIALFVALGGGAYAVAVPRNSVGPAQLKRNAVTAQKLKRNAVTAPKLKRNAVTGAKIKDRSLTARDFQAGALAAGAGARARDMDPVATPGATVRETSITLRNASPVFVLATLRDPFLTCGGIACASHYGVYVDGAPVPSTGQRLQAEAGAGDGFAYTTLFGLSAPLAPGAHSIKLARTDLGGPASAGELGAQLGAIALGG